MLDRVEHSFERLLEGSIARIFRSPVQPAEIGRKLERAMIDKQVVSVGTTLVPNEFHVSLHPRDLDAFAGFLPSLCRQMESWLTDVAAKRGLTMVDRSRVEIASGDGIPRRAIRIEASIADRAPRPLRADGDAQRTEIFRSGHGRSNDGKLRVRFIDGPRRGQEMDVRLGITTVGRALDNDLVLDVTDVSRHHARFESTLGQVKVIDLESTNGTRVNGERIRTQNIGPGDKITFGTVTIEVLSPSAGGT